MQVAFRALLGHRHSQGLKSIHRDCRWDWGDKCECQL